MLGVVAEKGLPNEQHFADRACTRFQRASLRRSHGQAWRRCHEPAVSKAFNPKHLNLNNDANGFERTLIGVAESLGAGQA